MYRGPTNGIRQAPQGETSNEALSSLLTEELPQKQLLDSKKLFLTDTDDEKLKLKYRYEYALCLVRSRYTSDVKQLIDFAENECESRLDAERSYFFLLSIGYARLRKFPIAIKYVKLFLIGEKGNLAMIAWREFLRDEMERHRQQKLIRAGIAS